MKTRLPSRRERPDAPPVEVKPLLVDPAYLICVMGYVCSPTLPSEQRLHHSPHVQIILHFLGPLLPMYVALLPSPLPFERTNRKTMQSFTCSSSPSCTACPRALRSTPYATVSRLPPTASRRRSHMHAPTPDVNPQRRVAVRPHTAAVRRGSRWAVQRCALCPFPQTGG
jgi:hypothetical protein